MEVFKTDKMRGFPYAIKFNSGSQFLTENALKELVGMCSRALGDDLHTLTADRDKWRAMAVYLGATLNNVWISSDPDGYKDAITEEALAKLKEMEK